VCVREREIQRERECVCVCVRERERERKCVCVRERMEAAIKEATMFYLLIDLFIYLFIFH
jgi:hypothetical protein